VIELNHRVIGPESALDLFPGDHIARTFQEHGEDLKGLVLEPDPQTVFAQFPGSKVKFKDPEARDASSPAFTHPKSTLTHTVRLGYHFPEVESKCVNAVGILKESSSEEVPLRLNPSDVARSINQHLMIGSVRPDMLEEAIQQIVAGASEETDSAQLALLKVLMRRYAARYLAGVPREQI
jgi:hypothetical protein